MSQLAIGPNTRVTLHFTLKLEDGAVIDSTLENSAPSFVFGDGSLLAGVEQKLVGMSAGDKESLQILPEDAFGQPNIENVQQFPRSEFDDDMELAEGLIISFADAKGEVPGVVTILEDDVVTVDFNHPLSGKNLQFDVEILDVEAVEA